MYRRQVLRSYVGLGLGYTVIHAKAWGREWGMLSEETSEYFSMTVNGSPVVVNHAAGSYSYVNLDVTKSVDVVITALKPDFWKNGVEILPTRHGILQGCKDVLFDNIKVVGGTNGNANQDGIDCWGAAIRLCAIVSLCARMIFLRSTETPVFMMKLYPFRDRM